MVGSDLRHNRYSVASFQPTPKSPISDQQAITVVHQTAHSSISEANIILYMLFRMFNILDKNPEID